MMDWLHAPAPGAGGGDAAEPGTAQREAACEDSSPPPAPQQPPPAAGAADATALASSAAAPPGASSHAASWFFPPRPAQQAPPAPPGTAGGSAPAGAPPAASPASRPRPPHAKPALPVYVMLPLDTVSRDGVLTNAKALPGQLARLRAAGCEGVMVDVWWGVVERAAPRSYDWGAYVQLLGIVKASGLRLQACLSFHACGANVGDVVDIPLPSWVLECALRDPDMLFTDAHGYRNPECLSLFADGAATLAGRTPLQCYSDFMRSFRAAVEDDLGTVLVDVSIGCGPCGELRYPAYPENRRCPAASQWCFPGVGEFQCYDKRALLSLAQAASQAGHIEWGGSGPHDAGGYNDLPHDTGFFRSYGGSWDSPYGHFFLGWYSNELVLHGERVLRCALDALQGAGVTLSLKLAGVHWWYATRSHAAELTAGYWNARAGDSSPERNGYEAIVATAAKLGVAVNFTCVEMRDSEHPWDARCGPEGLLRQVRATAAAHGVPVMGENALCRFDAAAYERVIANCLGDGRWGCATFAGAPQPPQPATQQAQATGGGSSAAASPTSQPFAGGGGSGGGAWAGSGGAAPPFVPPVPPPLPPPPPPLPLTQTPPPVPGALPPLASFTFLRLTPSLFEDNNFRGFAAFVGRIREATRAGPVPPLPSHPESDGGG